MWRHGAWADAPYIGVMAAVGHKEDGLRSALVEHGRDDGEVGQVGAARLRVISQDDVAAFQVRAQGAHLVPHRVLKRKRYFFKLFASATKYRNFYTYTNTFYVHFSFARIMLKLLICFKGFAKPTQNVKNLAQSVTGEWLNTNIRKKELSVFTLPPEPTLRYPIFMVSVF